MIKELISDIDGTIYEYESNKKIVIERLWGYWRDHLSLSREVYKEAGLIFEGTGWYNHLNCYQSMLEFMESLKFRGILVYVGSNMTAYIRYKKMESTDG